MPPRFDEDGNPLPRNLRDVKNDGRQLSDEIQDIGNEEQKSEAQSLIKELDTVVDECLVYEETNEKITSENEDNANENEQLSAEIKEQEKLLDQQEQEIAEQLSDVEAELEAARNSKPPDPALIAELEKMKEALNTSSQQLKADRQRLYGCAQKSQRVTSNCNTIRNDCNEVRQRIYAACNPGGPGVGLGGSTGSGSDNESGLAGFDLAALLLDVLRAEVARMSELRDYLAVKVPEIQAKHDENTALLAETKAEVTEIKNNTAERGQTLTSSKDRLAAIKAERSEKQQAVSTSDQQAPPPVRVMPKLSAIASTAPPAVVDSPTTIQPSSPAQDGPAVNNPTSPKV